ncbi:hypothetical protein BH11ACT1_BH11ACT1_26680 [soil metagenome]
MRQPSVETPEVVERFMLTTPGGAVLGKAVIRLTPLAVADADELFATAGLGP